MFTSSYIDDLQRQSGVFDPPADREEHEAEEIERTMRREAGDCKGKSHADLLHARRPSPKQEEV